ncbi:acyl-CoA thioesterase [Nocardioides sp. MAHUQ-72]|uniref:acyl-CoA thioesterase n=1 Tax=unclassified Nocardioides TaxID=2615069 RepID=UPI003614D760
MSSSAEPVVPGATSELTDWLDVVRVDADRFSGWCHGGAPLRAMGGLVAAQALMAAGHTVDPGHAVHSLHGYFLRSGDTRRPVEYAVERLRDGRSYDARRVVASQAGEPIFTLAASFKAPEGVDAGPERQPAMPDVTPPEDLVDAWQVWSEIHPVSYEISPYAHVTELRVVPAEDAVPGREGEILQHVWLRSSHALDEGSLLHASALTYLSDISLAQTATLEHDVLYPLRRDPSRLALASIDHAVWFHRPFRADEWLLFAQRSPSAGDGRGLNHGEFWTRDGVLVASAAQESVLRNVRTRPSNDAVPGPPNGR